MNKKILTIKALVALFLIIGILFFSAASYLLNQRIEFFPAEYNKPFPRNPFKGWVAWGKSPLFEEYSQPYSMIFVIVHWHQIEPVRGNFDWASFERYWHFDHAKGNKKIVLRVVLDYPKGPTDMEIPNWLYDKIEGRGTHYDHPERGKGFSPDYSNPTLIAEHERFMKMLGERYNNDPRIAFIQAGSLGHWGEWHTSPLGTGEFPDYDIAEEYLRHYTQSFPDKIVMVRRPLEFLLKNKNIGLYNDSMASDATFRWLDWIRSGYTSRWDKKTHPGLDKNWWHKRCSAGEFASYEKGIQHWIIGNRYEITLEQIKDSHTSWIGPQSAGKIPNSSDYQEAIDNILKKLGYRYVIESVSCKKYVLAGQRFSMDLVIDNTGVAPIYYNWPIEISLINSSKEIVYTGAVPSIDIRGWLPGENAVSLSITIPGYMKGGKYDVALAIVNPDSRDIPGIDFAVDQDLKRPDGKYILGTVSVINIKDSILGWFRSAKK